MKQPLPPLRARELGDQVPRRGHWLLALLGRFILYLLGWRIVGRVPNVPSAVLAVAPHTSNYDGLVGISALQALSLDVRFMAKDSLFEGRKGKIMRWFGGIPVDRSNAGNMVAQTAAIMAAKPFWLGLAPEGTRKGAASWKTGFHRIASAAQVPVVVIGFCYQRKQIRIVDHFMPTEDVQADMERMMAALADVEPRRPERLSAPLRFRRLSD